MPTGDFPTKIVLPKGVPFTVPHSEKEKQMEIVKIDGLPKEDGWYWFTGKAKTSWSSKKVVADFDQPIYWINDAPYPDAHICGESECFIYESGEFWQIRKTDDA